MSTLFPGLGKKTLKREYAFTLFCLLVHQTIFGTTQTLEVIVWPFLSFIAAVAGIHTFTRGQEGNGDAQ